MLLAKLFARLRNMRTLRVFVLEIAAVFIGITGSLLVDNWREERQDRDILDHLLQATHYNALQTGSYVSQLYQLETDAMESVVTLAYGDSAALTDAELLQHFNNAAVDFNFPLVQPGYQRLLNMPQSIPFDHTMAELDYQFVQLFIETAELERVQRDIFELRRRLYGAAGLPDDVRNWTIDLVDAPAARMNVIKQTLVGSDRYLAEVDDAAPIRAALEQPAVQSMLRDLIGLRYRSAVRVVRWASWNDQVIATIRRYDPGIPLPIGVIEISGDATAAGWDGGLEMVRDAADPNVWRLRVELTEGQLKFRADNSFASNWGTPTTLENRAESMGFDFGGDPATVFPAGTAAFGGLNIPVRAGTWDVTFNSQTFEYSFDEIAPN